MTTTAERILQLVEEIHAHLCTPDTKKPKSAGFKTSRRRFKNHLLDLFQPGKCYIAENFIEALTAKGFDLNRAKINVCLRAYAKEGKLVKLGANIYKLKD